jgi:hypothetical protein
MHFSINEFDYLILQTGYTSRLIEYGPEIFRNFTDDDNYQFICLIIDYSNESLEELFNIADIISIIGSESEYSYCNSLNMNTLTNLEFYEKNGKIVLIASFDITS